MEWSIFALTLLVVGCICAGVTGAVVSTWRLRVDVHELKDAVAVVQAIQNREVKVRAGQERWKRPEKDAALVNELLAKNNPAPRQLNWWERPDLVRSVDAK